jgi:hypothetical protein
MITMCISSLKDTVLIQNKWVINLSRLFATKFKFFKVYQNLIKRHLFFYLFYVIILPYKDTFIDDHDGI